MLDTPSMKVPSTALEDDHLDLVFRALGDRTRRSLLRRLREAPASVGELAEPFAMSLPAVSKHLRVLERAKLISREIDGRVHRCALSPSALASADEWLDAYRHFWSGSLDSLAKHLEDGGDE